MRETPTRPSLGAACFASNTARLRAGTQITMMPPQGEASPAGHRDGRSDI